MNHPCNHCTICQSSRCAFLKHANKIDAMMQRQEWTRLNSMPESMLMAIAGPGERDIDIASAVSRKAEHSRAFDTVRQKNDKLQVWSPVSKQVPGRDWELRLANELLLILWECGHKALEGDLPFAVYVIPYELDADAMLQKLLHEEVGICVAFSSVAVHHSHNLAMATKGSSQGGNVILRCTRWISTGQLPSMASLGYFSDCARHFKPCESASLHSRQQTLSEFAICNSSPFCQS